MRGVRSAALGAVCFWGCRGAGCSAPARRRLCRRSGEARAALRTARGQAPRRKPRGAGIPPGWAHGRRPPAPRVTGRERPGPPAAPRRGGPGKAGRFLCSPPLRHGHTGRDSVQGQCSSPLLRRESLSEGFLESGGASGEGTHGWHRPFSLLCRPSSSCRRRGTSGLGSLGHRPGALGQRLLLLWLGEVERSVRALPQPPSHAGGRLEVPGPGCGADRLCRCRGCGGARSVAPSAVRLSTPASRTPVLSGRGTEVPFLSSLCTVPRALLSFSCLPPNIALQ